MAQLVESDAALQAAGAPAGIPEEMKATWMTHHNSYTKGIVFVRGEGRGLYMENRGTQLASYAPLFHLELDDATKVLYAVCNVSECTVKIRMSYVEAGKVKIKMQNLVAHLWGHARVLSTLEDYKKHSPLASASSGGGKKARVEESEAAGRNFTRAERTAFSTSACLWLAGAGLPWVTVNSAAFKKFCEENGLPVISDDTVRRAFDKVYEQRVGGLEDGGVQGGDKGIR